jgi:large subunit ribosomal protein L35
MPKMKSHKGLRKRIRVSATGKIKFKRANSGHLMSGKAGNRKRKLRKPAILAGKVQDAMRIAVLGKA